jgi:hypothetical protein
MLRRFAFLSCLLWLLSLAACDVPLRQWGPLAGGALAGFNHYAQLPATARNVPYVPDGDPAQVLDIYAVDAPGRRRCSYSFTAATGNRVRSSFTARWPRAWPASAW